MLLHPIIDRLKRIIILLPNIASSLGFGLKNDLTYNFNNNAIEDFITNVNYTSNYSYSSVIPYTQQSDANNGKPNGVNVNLKSGILREINNGNENNNTIIEGSKTLHNFQPFEKNSYAVIDTNKVYNYGTVSSSGHVRVIFGESIKNVRDIGGWTCSGGNIRYGILYRSSELTGLSGNQMNETDKNMFLNLLGLKAELDMRDSVEDGGTPSFGNSVTYLHQTIGNYQDAFSANNKAKFKTACEFIMNNAIRQLPTIYHCVAGADRTGTITWILLGVLGVSQSDCDKEYEITNFSGPERLRTTYLSGLYNYINSLNGDDFEHKCMQALLDCGITIELINQFRKSIIDGNPIDLEPNEVIIPKTVVINDLKACTRMSYSPQQTCTSMSEVIGNDNGGIALAVTTSNDWSFVDRESGTYYLMPIPSDCNKVTITTTDTQIIKYKFSTLLSNNGVLTRKTNSDYQDSNIHTWNTNESNYICISCIYSIDGTIKPSWSYDTSKITVTFTNY